MHFGSELKAKNQIEGKVWQKHEEIFCRNCEKLIKPEDTLVLVGDHSWGKNLAEAEKDLEYIRYSLVSGDYLRWHPMKVL